MVLPLNTPKNEIEPPLEYNRSDAYDHERSSTASMRTSTDNIREIFPLRLIQQ